MDAARQKTPCPPCRRGDSVVPLTRFSQVGLACIIAALAAFPAAAAPQVVVSIKPLHSLIAGVMAGLGEPALIVASGASPHEYAMKPSDAARLEHADIVFWIGPIFESFLARPLDALSTRAEIVELDRAPGVNLLPAREGGLWEEEEPHRAGRSEDGHLWLDPKNATAIVRYAVVQLSALDPPHAPRYAENGSVLADRLEALDARLRGKLAPVRQTPFVVFHDAYQYFERRYGLTAIGSITVSPEHLPGARRIEEIRGKIERLGARCVFSEPPFEPRLVDTLIAGTPVHRGALDPEATTLAPGPDLYFQLMDGLADGLVQCLS
jgi:zinc transport system substrate-binding protein